MILDKNNIHMNRVKSRANIQFTIDEDINVSDSKADISRIICSKPQVQLDSVNYNDKKVNVNGKCSYSVLYISDDDAGKIESLLGDISFNETLNVEDIAAEDVVKCNVYIEDMNIRIVNSRKISVKAIVNVVVAAENIYDEEIVCGVTDNKSMCKMDTINYACIALNGNDIFRIKEEMELPKNKPDINRILWKDVSLKNRQVRLMDDCFQIKGELGIFILYDTYEDGIIEWFETTMPFAGKIDYAGMNEEMISDIVLSLVSGSLEVKEDADGEERQLSVEAVINLDIRVYEEKRMEYLADIYSLESCLTPVKKSTVYEQLLIKNSAKCRASDKVKIKPQAGRMLQICCTCGDVKIDEIINEEDGIMVEGAVLAEVMYIAADDKGPVAAIKCAIPFSQKIEVMANSEDIVYNVRPNIDQITTMVLGTDEIEVRAFINLEALVFKSIKAEFISEIAEEPLDDTWIANFPGIVGYIAGKEETVWDIAKKYHTTVDVIKNVNNMTSDVLKKGDKVLITR